MKENQLFINGRFSVNEAMHTVTDLEAGIETRLEQRLMKLIMLLVSHKGEVVTRQQIIADIWDDYGGADEGLSQAISFLRKIFADADKRLIRTIPKKGYVLDATVSTKMAVQPAPHRSVSPKPVKSYVIIGVIIVLVVAIIFFLLFRTTFREAIEPPGSAIDTTYHYQEMKEQANQKKQEDTAAEKR